MLPEGVGPEERDQLKPLLPVVHPAESDDVSKLSVFGAGGEHWLYVSMRFVPTVRVELAEQLGRILKRRRLDP